MSGVRMHFWQVVTRFLGGVISPVKYFFMGAIPELISRRLLSFWGISEKLGSRKCPLLSKNSKYISRKSFNPVHSIGSILLKKRKNAKSRTFLFNEKII